MGVKYKVVLSKNAEKDIDNIVLNLNSRFGERVASDTYEAILQEIESLANMPEAHPPYTFTHPDDKNVYRWVVAKKTHRIIYTFREEFGVIVVRIRHVKELGEHVALALLEEE